MMKETYERMSLVITEFDTEDVITTSGLAPSGNTPPGLNPDNQWEMPVNL